MTRRLVCYLIMLVAIIVSGCESSENLALTKVLDVMSPNPEIKGDKVGLIAGGDENHLIHISLNPSEISEGIKVLIPNDVLAYNGKDAMFVHNTKFGTEASFNIVSIDRKNKSAKVNISAKLVSVSSDKRSFLNIPTSDLVISGRQFDNLMAGVK